MGLMGSPNTIWNMNVRLTFDHAGDLVIPKPLREELYLEPGDTVEMPGTGSLTKEHGVWVLRTVERLPASATDEMLQEIRVENLERA
jgi:bifunctional DNA-binding transcriptional regulator/antitoxin component of YhaV-PrlF toxin-antitoxin module